LFLHRKLAAQPTYKKMNSIKHDHQAQDFFIHNQTHAKGAGNADFNQ
jgi:hypothetical protein